MKYNKNAEELKKPCGGMKRQGPCRKGARTLALSSCFVMLAEVSIGLAGLIMTTPCPK